MSLKSLAAALASTGFSQALADAPAAIPTLQTVHIAAIGVLLVSALVTCLRTVGYSDQGRPPLVGLQTAGAVAFSVLALTGATLVAGEPSRALDNRMFWLKMALVTGFLASCAALYIQLRRLPSPPRRSLIAQALSAGMVALLIAIICAGRWIAYSI